MATTTNLIDDRAAWLEARRNYLGGTDIGAILGYNKYATPYDVYASKVLGETSDAGRKAEAGTVLEPLVRKWYAEDIGGEIVQLHEPIIHPEYPFLAGNVDGIIPGVCVWECKTYDFNTASQWGEPNTDQVPVWYWAQAQWYTGFAQLPFAVIVALDRGTMEYTCYEVPHAPDVFARMVEEGVKFWRNHIETKTPPPLTPKDAGRIIELFPTPEVAEIGTTPEIDDMVGQLIELGRTKSQAEKAAKPLKDALHLALGRAQFCHTAHGVVKVVRVKETQVAPSTKAAYSFIKLP